MRTFTVTIVMLTLLATLHAHLFVLNSESQTLSRLDIDDWSIDNAFATIGQYPYAAPNRIAVHDETAWITVTYENSIQGIPLDDGGAGAVIYLEDSAAPYDIITHEGMAYVTGGTSNKVYRVDLDALAVTGSLDVGRSPQGMVVHDGLLYVCNTGFRLDTWTYDPGTVTVIEMDGFTAIDTLDCATNPQVAAVVGDELHVVCTGDYATEFGRIDIFGLTGHEFLESLDTGGSPGRVSVCGDSVFLGNVWPAGVFVYSASERELIYTPDTSPYTGGTDVYAQDGRLTVLDAGDFVQNSHVRVYSLADNSLLADATAGVGAVDVKAWSAPVSVNDDTYTPGETLLQVWPNPVRESCRIAFSPASGSGAEAAVFNVRGQMVRQLQLDDGRGRWDGRDSLGRLCPSGVYLVRVKTGESSAAKRLTLLR
ncbi:MAG: T9SS type A sorting domain-containing protein [Candidatus Cloacimonetes bacterium]|nr:T9SS type A sorting domain-containing protein [Candidatus Cloacimonadota bacterium]